MEYMSKETCSYDKSTHIRFRLMFSFEGSNPSKSWGRSSAGRAPALQAGGQEFDSPHLHQRLRSKRGTEGQPKR